MDAPDFELCGVPAIEKKWLSDFISKIQRAIKLQKVILFGSRATNEHVTWSDYDVAIVSKDDSSPRNQKRPAALSILFPAH